MGVFISYAEADRAAADKLRKGLATAGCSPWMAPASMQRRQDFPAEIADAICGSDYFAVLCSPDASKSDWVFRELMHAVANGKSIVPIWIADFPTTGRLRLMVGPIDWIDARSGVSQEVIAIAAKRLGKPQIGRVVTTLNLKGGVGKTTLTANLGVEAHFAMNRSVLFIDLDPQYNLTQYFLAEPQIEVVRESKRTILDLLDMRNATAADIARSRDAVFSLLEKTGERAGERPLDLLPGHDGLFEFTIDERSKTDMDRALGNMASFVNAARPFYSLILIDVNPSASFLTRCALSVSDHVMAPVRPERYALNGLRLLERWMARVRGRAFDASDVSVVINKMAERYPAASADLDDQTRKKILDSDTWGSSLAPSIIPYSVTLAPSAFGVAAEKPVYMAARFSRAQPDLRAAMQAVAGYVYGRAGAKDA